MVSTLSFSSNALFLIELSSLISFLGSGAVSGFSSIVGNGFGVGSDDAGGVGALALFDSWLTDERDTKEIGRAHV